MPHYLKETKVEKSGEYNDDDILLNIYESSIKARIDANFYKAKRTIVAELKAKKATDEEIVQGEIRVVNEKLKVYEDKTVSWKAQTPPNCFVASILCSAPGDFSFFTFIKYINST